MRVKEIGLSNNKKLANIIEDLAIHHHELLFKMVDLHTKNLEEKYKNSVVNSMAIEFRKQSALSDIEDWVKWLVINRKESQAAFELLQILLDERYKAKFLYTARPAKNRAKDHRNLYFIETSKVLSEGEEIASDFGPLYISKDIEPITSEIEHL